MLVGVFIVFSLIQGIPNIKADTQNEFIVTSAGEDGILGTSDDIYATDKINTIKSAVDTTKYNISTMMPSNTNSIRIRYLIFDIYGRQNVGDGYVTITEIKLYDNNNSIVNYTPIAAYDFYTKGNPLYWDGDPFAKLGAIWDKSKLNDGNIYYVDNYSGRYSSAVFYGSKASTNNWCRFAIDLGTLKQITRIEIYAGSPEGRIPQYI